MINDKTQNATPINRGWQRKSNHFQGLKQPWVMHVSESTARRLRQRSIMISDQIQDATLSGLERDSNDFPGLKQPWAS